MFADGYHKDKLFGGADKGYTDKQELVKIYTILKISPEIVKNPELIADGTFMDKNPIKQLGIELKATTKIQGAFRKHLERNPDWQDSKPPAQRQNIFR